MWSGHMSIVSLNKDKERINIGIILIGKNTNELIWKINEELIPNDLKDTFLNLYNKYSTYEKINNKIINKLKHQENQKNSSNLNDKVLVELNRKTKISLINISLPKWFPYEEGNIEEVAIKLFNEYVSNRKETSIINQNLDTEYFLQNGEQNPIQPCIRKRKLRGQIMQVAIYNGICNKKPDVFFKDIEEIEKEGLPKPHVECEGCEFACNWNNDEEVKKSNELFIQDMNTHPWWVYVGKRDCYQIKQKLCLDCNLTFTPVNIYKSREEVEIKTCPQCGSHNLNYNSLMDLKLVPPKTNEAIYESAKALSSIRNVFKNVHDSIEQEDKKMIFNEYKLFNVEISTSKRDREMTYQINAKSAKEAKEKAELIYNNSGIILFIQATVIEGIVIEDDYTRFIKKDYSKCDYEPMKEEYSLIQQEIMHINKKYS